MKIRLVQWVQKIFNFFGLHLRRLNSDVSLVSALEEQIRLAGPSIKVILEVGAADGRDSLVYTKHCKQARVYAYEPIPDSFFKLKSLAEQENRLIPVNAAVSNKSGTADMYQTNLDDASSLLKPIDLGGTLAKYHKVSEVIKVKTVRMDDEMERLKISEIDILKIDAQGAELDVLSSFGNFLSDGLIKVIYIEVCFIQLYKGGVLYHDLAKNLTSVGYKLHSFYDLVHNPNGSLAWGDAIFVRSN